MYINSFMFSLQLMDGCWGTRDVLYLHFYANEMGYSKYFFSAFLWHIEMYNVISFVQGIGICFRFFYFFIFLCI